MAAPKVVKEMEVVDARGEALGRVTQREKACFLVEKTGLVRQAIMIMNDEVSAIEDGKVHLRLALADLQHRPGRHGPNVAAPFGPDDTSR